MKTLCWIGWRLSQSSPKALLHLLRSPSGPVRVGNPRRSRALAQSGCRGGSFFFVGESTLHFLLLFFSYFFLLRFGSPLPTNALDFFQGCRIFRPRKSNLGLRPYAAQPKPLLALPGQYSEFSEPSSFGNS